MTRLDGKRVLLVGVSAGLGAATAYHLLKEGARVTMVARDEKKLQRLVDMLCPYGKIDYVKGNVLTQDGAEKVVEQAVRSMHGIDRLAVLVGGYMEDDIRSLDALETMITNHIKIPLYVVKASVPHLRKGSSIVLVSAMSGLESAPAPISYGIGKAGVAKAVQILAGEMLNRGVRVNAVAPSSINGAFRPERDWKKMRKLGDWQAPPEDFARVIVWLMTDEADWVDGAVIPVDGGTRFKE